MGGLKLFLRKDSRIGWISPLVLKLLCSPHRATFSFFQFLLLISFSVLSRPIHPPQSNAHLLSRGEVYFNGGPSVEPFFLRVQKFSSRGGRIRFSMGGSFPSRNAPSPSYHGVFVADGLCSGSFSEIYTGTPPVERFSSGKFSSFPPDSLPPSDRDELGKVLRFSFASPTNESRSGQGRFSSGSGFSPLRPPLLNLHAGTISSNSFPASSADGFWLLDQRSVLETVWSFFPFVFSHNAPSPFPVKRHLTTSSFSHCLLVRCFLHFMWIFFKVQYPALKVTVGLRHTSGY